MLTITWEQFETQVKRLCEAQRGNPGWSWRWSHLEKVCLPLFLKYEF